MEINRILNSLNTVYQYTVLLLIYCNLISLNTVIHYCSYTVLYVCMYVMYVCMYVCTEQTYPFKGDHPTSR